ncbi:MAG: tetratricopeptide repeat protein [Candidatus Obscuribacterales bacterium]|nr:tetratricopeptide repeat protein [Candidatus Obscuribacterales bacterium]
MKIVGNEQLLPAILLSALLGSAGCGSAVLAQSWGQFKHAALTAVEQNNLPQAEKFWQSALQAASEYGPRDPRFCASVSGLAAVYRNLEKYSEAEALYKKVIDDVNTFQPVSDESKTCAIDYVSFLKQRQRPAEAIALAARLPVGTVFDSGEGKQESSPSISPAAFSAVVSASGPKLPEAKEGSKWTEFTEAGKQYLMQKNYQSAEKAFKQALDQVATLPANDVRVNQSFSNLSDLYLAWKKIPEADAAHHGSLAWIRKFRGPQSHDHVAALVRHGKLLRALNRKADAIAEEGKAEKIQFAITGRPDPDGNAFSSITTIDASGSILSSFSMNSPSGGGGGSSGGLDGGGGGYGASVGASVGRGG